MKIISYNVNGVRAAMTKGLIEWLQSANPDVLCLQEIKALESQIEKEAFEALGYKYQYWHSAEKKGYSGVAILSKTKPTHVEIGSGLDYMDKEGRILRADYGSLSVMSLYLPSGTNIDRLDFKLTFMADFQKYIDNLKVSFPNLIICGDYNICHQAIDIHDPIRNANVSGFLPVEREWLDGFMKSGFIDSFRYFNNEPHNYSWWSYRANARNNNKGWRIDYNLVAQPLENRLLRATILPEAKHSDHCPILVEVAD
ncbi:MULTISPECIES: exodeoxyribonuclease III [Capnocytophaga]|uniref:Exodeoxyribonuclease n=1 Tax=Capnocytophaga canis TaxID=1848903 RepID=A0A0B7IPT0_9FLAO|nr:MULTISPECIES: exodeoxyribonuclease III [Capnocytophaga]ATA72695.1 exodeoxyribonuclease III [Capnocytophaga sp. H4358]RIY36270.1 exodeoxyribonuclease III [Capnocytophaga canis]GIM60978.1 exodeoxyribonuclease III [Capnocytophaga canis]CEN53820.1 Exodeoxyribonuclease [Capnocytophaga canis]